MIKRNDWAHAREREREREREKYSETGRLGDRMREGRRDRQIWRERLEATEDKGVSERERREKETLQKTDKRSQKEKQR